MSALHSRDAVPVDQGQLLEMVRAFYLEDEIVYDAARVEGGLGTLLRDPSCGAVLLLGSGLTMVDHLLARLPGQVP